VNDALRARIQRMIADKLPASHGAELLSGMMDRYAKLRGRLAASWDAQRVWERHVSKSVHVPLDPKVCDAMVALCLLWRWPVTAFLLRASFLGYLRPGEAAALRRHEVLLPSDGTCSLVDSVVLVISSPKTRFRAARIQSVHVADALLATLGLRCVGRLPPTTRLCPGGYSSFSKKFQALLSTVGLSASPYTPASLRSGGAVADLFRGCSLTFIMFHGRWAAVKTTTHYLQSGLAAHVAATLPTPARVLVRTFAAALPELLDAYRH